MAGDTQSAPDTPPDGGRGEEPYLTPVQANKIASLLLHRHKRAKSWEVNAANMGWAMDATERNLLDADGRVSNGAVRNLLAMNAQNLQMDKEAWEVEHGSSDPQGGNHFHGPTQINLSNLTDAQLAELERLTLAAGNSEGNGGAVQQEPGLLPE